MTLEMDAHLVNGGLLDFTASEADVRKYRRMVREGYTGIDIIHELITDDWGAPPVYVRIHGRLEDNRRIDIRISYDGNVPKL